MADPPAVAMLWETADPASALEARFGFADAASAARWLADVLAAQWGVEVVSCERIVLSDRNALAWLVTADGPRVAKWCMASDRFAQLSELARLTDWLAGRGLPVSAPVPALDGRLQVEVDDTSIGLQSEVSGDLLDVGDPGQVHAAGATLAQLHGALAAYPLAERVAPRDARPASLRSRITRWLDGHADHLSATARSSMRALIDGAPTDPLPMQLVHYDFRSANLVVADDRIAAVLDFERTRFDHRVVELAHTATVLGTRYRDWGPISAEDRSRFLAGYRSVLTLSEPESRWLDILVLWHAHTMIPDGADPTGWAASAASQLSAATT